MWKIFLLFGLIVLGSCCQNVRADRESSYKICIEESIRLRLPPDQTFSDWNDAARSLIEAIKKRKTVRFPVAVNGQSLIPPEIFASMRPFVIHSKTERRPSNILKMGTIFVGPHPRKPEIFSVTVEYLGEDRANTSLASAPSKNFGPWFDYLNLGLKKPSERIPYDPEHPNVIPDNFPRMEAAQGREKKKDVLNRNQFFVDRKKTDYNNATNGMLTPLLTKLTGAKKVWLDMGAGSARVQTDRLNLLAKKLKFKDLPQFIAVAYKIPEIYQNRVDRTIENFPGKFSYVEGNQRPNTIKLFPKTDLLTDIGGIYSYADTTRQSLEIVKAYVDRLKPGGTALIYAVPNQNNFVAVRPWLEKQTDITFDNSTPTLLVIRKK